MRILVIAGRVGNAEWTAGEVVRAVVNGLIDRGHEVSLVAESVDDPAGFGRCAQVRAKNRFEQSASDFPFGFRAWARRQRGTMGHDACVSFSRWVRDRGVQVWMPLDPAAGSWVADVVGARGVVRATGSIVKHWGVLRALTPGAGARARRVLAVGAVAAQGARAACRGSDVREIEFFTPVEASAGVKSGEARTRVRELLGVRADQVLIAAGMTGRVGPSLSGLLSEVALAHGPMSPIAGPLVVVLTREQIAAHTLAVRAGAERFVRVVGMTGSVGEVIDASDAVALPTACPRGAFDGGALGRMAATALKLGKPLIAAAGAPGAELCSRRVDGQEAGTVVDGSFGSWRRALRMVADEGWRQRAGRAGAELGRGMTVDRLVTELTGILETAGTRHGER